MKVDDFSKVLQVIYLGMTESPPWGAALEQLRAVFAASQATLLMRPPSPGSSGALVTSGMNVSPQATESYRRHFFALDPFVGLPRDDVVTAHEWLGEKKWLESRIYQDFMRPIGMLHVMGADLFTGGLEIHLRLCRADDQPAFSEADKARCRLLLPHVKIAVALHSRMDLLACERQLFAGAVDRMLFGTVSLDPSGAPLEVSEQARTILAAKDGICLIGNRLRADNTQENDELQRLICQALGCVSDVNSKFAETMSLSRPSGQTKLAVLIRAVPLGEWSEGGLRPAAIVFLRDPEHKTSASLEVMRQLFGLTRSESMLALLLANGRSLEEAASELSVTHNTARAHLRSIYAKTGAIRQSDLVRLVLNNVISLSRP